jgi:hypothetical protein
VAGKYDVGDLVRLTATCTDADAVVHDPDAIVMATTDPDGNDVGYQLNLVSQGAWNASTNSPSLADGTGTAGHYYTVSVAGSVDFGNGSITFGTSDYVYYTGYEWHRLPNVSGTAITKRSTGIYDVNVYPSVAGIWYYRPEACGSTKAAADEVYFLVKERVVS